MPTEDQLGLPPALSTAIDEAAARWGANGRLGRLWHRDSGVWTGRDESQWLGWLEVPDPTGPVVARVQAFAERLEADRIRYVALLGMGGSSLFPDMLRQVFGHRQSIDFRVLDSTDPAQVRAFESTLDVGETVFIVSSKSGTTLETRLFFAYFLDRVRDRLGPDLAPSRFVAVTDPGSALDRLASAEGFRAVFHGDPAIRGRFSALSHFGLVPAAVLGLDVSRLLTSARDMMEACAPSHEGLDNPGVRLGLMLARAAHEGREKVTLLTGRSLHGFGAWVEQLVAESTGKGGAALIPVDGEALGAPGRYGSDRQFISLRLAEEADDTTEMALRDLEQLGHPVARFVLPSIYELGAECVRWEFATAVAASEMGLHPFDQPDVEAAKVASRTLTERHAAGRPVAELTPAFTAPYETGELSVFAPGGYGRGLGRLVVDPVSIDQWLASHLSQIGTGDYFAVLAYVEPCEPYRRLLDEIRYRVRNAYGVASTLGFGPRFLHSTGQAHKGGPNSGVFLAVTCQDVVDVEIAGEACSFGVVKQAQARGDEEVLVERQRRYLRIHIDGEVGEGLSTLATRVGAALAMPRPAGTQA